MQVSKNDTTLAHAMAKQEIEKASARLHAGAGRRVLAANSVKEFFRLLEAYFPGRIIDAAIGKPIGSRASASVFLVDTDSDGNIALTQLIFDAKLPARYRVTPHPVPIVVQRHAFARIIQRITGNGHLTAAVAAMQPHLHGALGWVRAQYPLEPGTELAISGRGLELAGGVDETGMLRLKTCIDAASMTSNLRKVWASGDKIEVRETYRPKVRVKLDTNPAV